MKDFSYVNVEGGLRNDNNDDRLFPVLARGLALLPGV